MKKFLLLDCYLEFLSLKMFLFLSQKYYFRLRTDRKDRHGGSADQKEANFQEVHLPRRRSRPALELEDREPRRAPRLPPATSLRPRHQAPRGKPPQATPSCKFSDLFPFLTQKRSGKGSNYKIY